MLTKLNNVLFRDAYVCIKTIKMNQRNDYHKIQNSGCKVTGNFLCLKIIVYYFYYSLFCRDYNIFFYMYYLFIILKELFKN